MSLFPVTLDTSMMAISNQAQAYHLSIDLQVAVNRHIVMHKKYWLQVLSCIANLLDITVAPVVAC